MTQCSVYLTLLLLSNIWQAMILEWIRTQSVLIISYPMFNNLYKTSPSDTRMFTIRKLLLENPTIMILDEGHIVRNKKAQVLKQLNAVKTPLRVMLSGSTQNLVLFLSREFELCKEVSPVDFCILRSN